MKKWIKIILFIGLIVGLLLPTVALAVVKVKGYYRKDGTYVQPHYRSNPNSSVWDNWSTKGNVNPYTGKAGTKDPLKLLEKKSSSGSLPSTSSQQGCCSWHSGVCGCSNGRTLCCDGTLSPTCTCSSDKKFFIIKPPRFFKPRNYSSF